MGRELGLGSAIEQDAFRDELRQSLEWEFAAAEHAGTLLISSEHFHSRLSSVESIQKLKDWLSPWVECFEVVVYLRRQDRVALSLFSTAIKAGNTRPVPFPGAPKGPPLYYFDYDRIYQNWSSVFGEEAMRVRLFEAGELIGGNLLNDFCTISGLKIEGKQIPKIENEALDKTGADFLLALNHQYPIYNEGQRNKERDTLARLVSKLCVGRYCPVSRDEAISFCKRYKESNERLRERVFVERSQALFDEDFSDYPEKPEPLEPDYERVVDLVMRIWQMKQ